MVNQFEVVGSEPKLMKCITQMDISEPVGGQAGDPKKGADQPNRILLIKRPLLQMPKDSFR